MNRKDFLKTCGFGCLGGISTLALLQSCSTSKISENEIIGSDILVPLTDFEIKNKETTAYKKYIIVRNEKLKYPICVYRFDANNYSALLMQCTHQGAELQVFGDKLQCAAHGSEFGNKGSVENGPADRNLRNFPITIDNDTLKISLK
jgi:Rieske Fe-S protein